MNDENNTPKATAFITAPLLQLLHKKVGGKDNAFAALFENKKTKKPYTGGAYANMERGTTPITEDFAKAALDTIAEALRIYGPTKRFIEETTNDKDK